MARDILLDDGSGNYTFDDPSGAVRRMAADTEKRLTAYQVVKGSPPTLKPASLSTTTTKAAELHIYSLLVDGAPVGQAEIRIESTPTTRA